MYVSRTKASVKEEDILGRSWNLARDPGHCTASVINCSPASLFSVNLQILNVYPAGGPSDFFPMDVLVTTSLLVVKQLPCLSHQSLTHSGCAPILGALFCSFRWSSCDNCTWTNWRGLYNRLEDFFSKPIFHLTLSVGPWIILMSSVSFYFLMGLKYNCIICNPWPWTLSLVHGLLSKSKNNNNN